MVLFARPMGRLAVAEGDSRRERCRRVVLGSFWPVVENGVNIVCLAARNYLAIRDPPGAVGCAYVATQLFRIGWYAKSVEKR